MKEFLYCILYFIVTGLLGFILGRILPKTMFHYDEFPYRCADFERGGALYDKLKIHTWQDRVPDMSKIFPQVMPAKKIKKPNSQKLLIMLRETCVAEFIHVLLCITGLGCFFIWKNPFCIVLYFIYVLVFHMPFILIQRYNRPRLLHLYLTLSQRESKKYTKENNNETSYSKL